MLKLKTAYLFKKKVEKKLESLQVPKKLDRLKRACSEMKTVAINFEETYTVESISEYLPYIEHNLELLSLAKKILLRHLKSQRKS